jgi:hypothetical protein
MRHGPDTMIILGAEATRHFHAGTIDGMFVVADMKTNDPSVPNLKFSGLQIDSKMADPPHFGEDWSWVDGLLRLAG